jgi:hypothetical protein
MRSFRVADFIAFASPNQHFYRLKMKNIFCIALLANCRYNQRNILKGVYLEHYITFFRRAA